VKERPFRAASQRPQTDNRALAPVEPAQPQFHGRRTIRKLLRPLPHRIQPNIFRILLTTLVIASRRKAEISTGPATTVEEWPFRAASRCPKINNRGFSPCAPTPNGRLTYRGRAALQARAQRPKINNRALALRARPKTGARTVAKERPFQGHAKLQIFREAVDSCGESPGGGVVTPAMPDRGTA